jgi:hypothetical protein
VQAVSLQRSQKNNRRPGLSGGKATVLLLFYRLAHVCGRRHPVGRNEHALVGFVSDLVKKVGFLLSTSARANLRYLTTRGLLILLTSRSIAGKILHAAQRNPRSITVRPAAADRSGGAIPGRCPRTRLIDDEMNILIIAARHDRGCPIGLTHYLKLQRHSTRRGRVLNSCVQHDDKLSSPERT